MGKVSALILTALGVGLLVYWLFAPRFTPLNPHSSSAPTQGTKQAGTQVPETGRAEHSTTDLQRPTPQRLDASSPQSRQSIEPPRSPQQREQDDLEAKRGPFYAALHQNGETLLAAFQPASDDPATLELYAVQNNNQTALQLLSLASRADAFHYGFRHIRIFLPNPPESVERYRLEAEATPDANGAWQAFRK